VIVEDAIRVINEAASAALLDEWRAAGHTLTTTREVTG
jgi:hypothetical protein